MFEICKSKQFAILSLLPWLHCESIDWPMPAVMLEEAPLSVYHVSSLEKSPNCSNHGCKFLCWYSPFICIVHAQLMALNVARSMIKFARWPRSIRITNITNLWSSWREVNIKSLNLNVCQLAFLLTQSFQQWSWSVLSTNSVIERCPL